MANLFQIGANMPAQALQSIFPGAGGQPSPAQGVDPMEMLRMVQQQRQGMFDNQRSPMVRRTVGGDIVDESRPSGLDSLRDIPHSWETAGNNTGNSYGRTGSDEPTPVQADIRRGTGGTAMMGKYGGGYSTNSDNPSPFAEAPIGNGTTDPLLLSERPTLVSNIQGAYNQALTSPFAEQPAPPPQQLMANEQSLANAQQDWQQYAPQLQTPMTSNFGAAAPQGVQGEVASPFASAPQAAMQPPPPRAAPTGQANPSNQPESQYLRNIQPMTDWLKNFWAQLSY